MISSVSVGSLFQMQTTPYRSTPAAQSISGSEGNDGQSLFLSSDSNVSISGAAQSKLANEQQTPNAAQSDVLPVGIKHMLEQMVDDPVSGAKYADGYANTIHTACMTLPQYLQVQGTLEAGISQLQAAWQSIQSEGKSPAQSYAELLKYELSMPKSYWNAQDPGHTMADIHAFAAAKLSYLEQYMAASK